MLAGIKVLLLRPQTRFQCLTKNKSRLCQLFLDTHTLKLCPLKICLLLKDVKMKADFFETKSEFKFPTAVTVVLPGKYRAR